MFGGFFDEDNPCKDCPDKGCGPYHDICDEYNKAKERNRLRKEAIEKKKRVNRMMDNYKLEVGRRMKKGKK